MKFTRRLSVIALVFAFLLPAGAVPRKPKLVVTIVVDQFRYDYLTRFRSEFHGGIARLLDQGAVFVDARYRQYPTVTAVGHSTLLSGATPSVSGIISNEWFDRTADNGAGKAVTSVVDDSTLRVGGGPGAVGASPRRLLVSTLGDELKMANKNSKVIGISIKDRSAILPAGHAADAAYWFDADSNHFVTSTWYMQKLPDWVKQVNDDRPVYKYLGANWLPLNAKPGDRPFCTMTAGTEVRFCEAIENTPFGNDLVEEFAEKAIVSENLGGHEGTDLLAISFSSNDYVGHLFGPDSPEVHDITIRTDQLLAKLLDFLNSRLGEGNTLVVFSADHGVSPTPKANNDRKMPGGYLDSADYSKKIAARLSEKFGTGDWFVYNAYGAFYLNRKTMTEKKLDPAEVRRVAGDFARTLPNIARAFTWDDLLSGQAASDFVGRAAQLGFYGPRSGDLILLPEPYYMFFSGSGTTHATPYGYDTHVPLIFYGAGVPKGIHYEPVAINDVAPTLAAILEVETPSGSSGRILAEILK